MEGTCKMFRMIHEKLHISENGYWEDAEHILRCADEGAPLFFNDSEYPNLLVLQSMYGYRTWTQEDVDE
jgi:hypothetical protein